MKQQKNTDAHCLATVCVPSNESLLIADFTAKRFELLDKSISLTEINYNSLFFSYIFYDFAHFFNDEGGLEGNKTV